MAYPSDPPRQPGGDRNRWHPAFLDMYRALAVIAVVAGFIFLLPDRAFLDDDYLYLYSGSYLLEHTEDFDAAKKQSYDALERIEAGPETLYRAKFRDGAEDNYRITVLSAYLTRLMTPELPETATAANENPVVKDVLLNRLTVMFALGFSLAVLLFWGALRAVRDPVVLGAVATMLLAIALVELLPLYSAPINFNNFPHWRDMPLGPGETVAGEMADWTWRFLVHPGPAFAPYDMPPKNQLQLVLISVLALRWSDRRTLAYGVLAAACFFHHSYGAILVVLLFGLDSWFRPEWSRRPSILLLSAVPVAANLLRSALGADVWAMTLFMPAVGWGAIALWLLALPRLAPGFGGWPRWLASASGPAQDLATFWVLMLSSAVLFGLISLYVPPLDAKYFWGNIHSRLLGLMLLPTYVGLLILIFRALHRRLSGTMSDPWRKGLRGGGLAVLCGAALTLVWGTAASEPWRVLAQQSQAQLAARACAFDEPVGAAFETSFYVAMIADIETSAHGNLDWFFRECDA